VAAEDPRQSLDERYATHDAYVARARAAADRLLSDRMLLPADGDQIVRQAQESGVLKP
jgi:hypothetical protein